LWQDKGSVLIIIGPRDLYLDQVQVQVPNVVVVLVVTAAVIFVVVEVLVVIKFSKY